MQRTQAPKPQQANKLIVVLMGIFHPLMVINGAGGRTRTGTVFSTGRF